MNGRAPFRVLAVLHPDRQPRCRGIRWNPLDRWLCVPIFRWVCPYVGGYYAQRLGRSKEQVADFAMGRNFMRDPRCTARHALCAAGRSCCSALRARFSSSSPDIPRPQRCGT